tara:strand:+ start:2163 stop:2462 length:300 start_codon:yes stop_codon:yes gene_type:complete
VSQKCNDFSELVNEFESYINDYGDEQLISVQNYYTASFQAYLSGLNMGIYLDTNYWRDLNFNTSDYMYSYMQNYCNKNPTEKLTSGLIQYYGDLPKVEE